MDRGPVLVHETRDGRVQAMHSGHAVLLTPEGQVKQAWGDPDFPTYWRSAPKPLQAIPFAAVIDSFGLSDRALALACASHAGEPEHLAWAQAMLNAGHLEARSLQCSTHPPMSRHSVRPTGGPTPIHNNCSGKHAGMMLACLANGWPIDSYTDADHPLQQDIRRLVGQATGRSDVPYGTDGCSIPTFWLPISDLAKTYQWVAQHDVGLRCIDAMAKHPWFVAGTDRFCTVLGEASSGACVGKVGAAGVYVMLHRPTGSALAVKLTDADARSAEVVAGTIAAREGWIDAAHPRLAPFIARSITSNAGKRLGAYEPQL